MFEPRKKSKILADNFFILDDCVPAKSFNRCTHVLVKVPSDFCRTEPGLYTYSLNNVICLDGQEHVKLIVTQNDLRYAEIHGDVEVLCHMPTWNEIEKEILSKINNN